MPIELHFMSALLENVAETGRETTEKRGGYCFLLYALSSSLSTLFSPLCIFVCKQREMKKFSLNSINFYIYRLRLGEERAQREKIICISSCLIHLFVSLSVLPSILPWNSINGMPLRCSPAILKKRKWQASFKWLRESMRENGVYLCLSAVFYILCKAFDS